MHVLVVGVGVGVGVGVLAVVVVGRGFLLIMNELLITAGSTGLVLNNILLQCLIWTFFPTMLRHCRE